MNISHKNRFVWTAPPKVGSRTVRDIFKKHCDLNPHWPSEDHPSDFTHANQWPDDAEEGNTLILDVTKLSGVTLYAAISQNYSD